MTAKTLSAPDTFVLGEGTARMIGMLAASPQKGPVPVVSRPFSGYPSHVTPEVAAIADKAIGTKSDLAAKTFVRSLVDAVVAATLKPYEGDPALLNSGYVNFLRTRAPETVVTAVDRRAALLLLIRDVMLGCYAAIGSAAVTWVANPECHPVCIAHHGATVVISSIRGSSLGSVAPGRVENCCCTFRPRLSYLTLENPATGFAKGHVPWVPPGLVTARTYVLDNPNAPAGLGYTKYVDVPVEHADGVRAFNEAFQPKLSAVRFVKDIYDEDIFQQGYLGPNLTGALATYQQPHAAYVSLYAMDSHTVEDVLLFMSTQRWLATKPDLSEFFPVKRQTASVDPSVLEDILERAPHLVMPDLPYRVVDGMLKELGVEGFLAEGRLCEVNAEVLASMADGAMYGSDGGPVTVGVPPLEREAAVINALMEEYHLGMTRPMEVLRGVLSMRGYPDGCPGMSQLRFPGA